MNDKFDVRAYVQGLLDDPKTLRITSRRAATREEQAQEARGEVAFGVRTLDDLEKVVLARRAAQRAAQK